jgi:hypothetical protein
MLASLLYPYDADAPGLIEGWLDELEHQDHIRRYEVDGSAYLEICNFLEHQKIDRPSKSKIPSPAKPREDSSSTREELLRIKEGIKDQGRDREGTAREVSPSLPALVPLPLSDGDDPVVATRVLCERIGVFDLRQQSDTSRLFQAFRPTHPELSEEAAVDHVVGRWEEYRRAENAGELEWNWGSAHKFLMSGKWDDPRAWPWRRNRAPTGARAEAEARWAEFKASQPDEVEV